MGEIKKNPYIAEWLRAKGLKVVEYPGWEERSRPASTGSFNPQGIMIHHDASPKGPSPALPRYCAEVGSPTNPPPVCHLWVAYDGTWHVLAAGRANHAGLGGGADAAPSARWIPRNSGNAYTYGIEVDHTTGEIWPRAQYESLVKGVAALVQLMGQGSAERVTSHKEYAPGRKIDPHGINMDVFRSQVQRALTPASKPKPPVKPKPKPKPLPVVNLRNVQPGKTNSDVTVLQKALMKAGYDIPLLRSGRAEYGYFGAQTKHAYALWQRKLGFRGKDADGRPGLQSLTRLGRKTGFKAAR
jgi:N-acetyl-anhydromuramyl-L-alanine amidase AmpD